MSMYMPSLFYAVPLHQLTQPSAVYNIVDAWAANKAGS